MLMLLYCALLTLFQILGWAGLAKVDGQAYIWMGIPGIPNVNVSKATQKSLQVDTDVFIGLVDYTYSADSSLPPKACS